MRELELMCNHEPVRVTIIIYLSGLPKMRENTHCTLSPFALLHGIYVARRVDRSDALGSVHDLDRGTQLNGALQVLDKLPSPLSMIRFGRPIMRSLIVDAMHPQRPLKLHTACVALP